MADGPVYLSPRSARVCLWIFADSSMLTSSCTASGPTGIPACFPAFSISAGQTPSCSSAMPSLA